MRVLSPLKVQKLPNVSSLSTANHSLYFVDPQTGVHTQKHGILPEPGKIQDKVNEIKIWIECMLIGKNLMWKEVGNLLSAPSFRTTRLCEIVC
jgi:hypothetical protein